MAINYPEIALIVALNAAILAAIGLYVRYRVFPVLKAEAGNWAGAAIGRFWQTLSEKATEDEGGTLSGSSPSGALELGGFKIDANTVKTVMELVKVAQSFGFLKGGTGGTANPFLK